MQDECQRVCQRCGVAKPLKSFPTAPRCKGGRRPVCHKCKEGRTKGPISTSVPKVPNPAIDEARVKVLAERTSKRYLITAAQNATPVHGPFWQTLKTAAVWLNAEILVVPLRYKNPTSIFTDREYDTWAEEVTPYLFNRRKALNKNLVLCADVRTQPTASAPLSGLESLTGAESCIIGHTKMQFRTVAVPSGRFPKILTTTGACTVSNFTDTKTGKIGEFHHYLGAILVEIDGGYFHIRQLNADTEDGSFIDVDTLFTRGSVSSAPPALALVTGDIHARFCDPKVDDATFGPRGIVEAFSPETVVFEDLNDDYAVNPHHLGNPFIAQAKLRARFGNVREEVVHAAHFVQKRTVGRKAVVVASNHDDFLARWMVRADWKTDPVNARFYLQTALMMVDSAEMTPGGAKYADPFRHWMKQLAPEVRCLGPDESFTIAGIECSLHGDRGPNGARGSLKNLSRMGVKVISGHTHSPGIEEGHYQCGTSTPLRLEYNTGPSSWLNTHCVIYANGKRCLVTVIDGKWRLDPEDDLDIVVDPEVDAVFARADQ